jgi:ribulose-5-phosphate 4-epimerase/fuculose-1-phosphate aldolase
MASTEVSTAVQDVIDGCRVLGNEDMGDPVWGHVSLRDPDGDGIYVKTGGAGFEEVTAEDIVHIDFDGNTLEGSRVAPKEYPLHTEVMKMRSDVNAVVHCHPPYAIALGATGKPLQVFSTAAGPFSAGVPHYERYIALIDTEELGIEMSRALGDARALQLISHGIITVGSSVATAVTAAVLFERACRLQLLVEGAGGLDPSLAEWGDRYRHAQSDGYMLRTWEYLLRQIR